MKTLESTTDAAGGCSVQRLVQPSRPKALDLFCCAGGAAMGLHRAGYDVTGVDIQPQPRYPFKFVQGDALAQDLSGYDFVWASPPCQGYCALKTMTNAREHPKLIEEVRAMLTAWGGPWIIENVEGAKNELRNPVMLCGSMFGLESNGFQLRRHRYFESNVPLTAPGPCCHAPKTLGVYGAKVRDIAQEKRHYGQPKETRGKPVGVVLPQAWGFEAMGVDWMKIEEASEAIPPAFSEYLARQTLRVTARLNVKLCEGSGQ
jgi:DNA (cytosine-5)-methyltransferase 1